MSYTVERTELDRFKNVSVVQVERKHATNAHWGYKYIEVNYESPSGGTRTLSRPSNAPKNLKSFARSIIKQRMKRKQARIDVLKDDIQSLETEIADLEQAQKDVNDV